MDGLEAVKEEEEQVSGTDLVQDDAKSEGFENPASDDSSETAPRGDSTNAIAGEGGCEVVETPEPLVERIENPVQDDSSEKNDSIIACTIGGECHVVNQHATDDSIIACTIGGECHVVDQHATDESIIACTVSGDCHMVDLHDPPIDPKDVNLGLEQDETVVVSETAENEQAEIVVNDDALRHDYSTAVADRDPELDPMAYSFPEEAPFAKPEYRSYPLAVTCPYCMKIVVTKTTSQIGSFSWLVCVFLCCICCCFGLVALCLKSTKDVNHHCPECGKFLSKHIRM